MVTSQPYSAPGHIMFFLFLKTFAMQGGNLICCDNCPAAWHVRCAGLRVSPDDDEEFVCPTKCQKKR